MSRQLKTSDRSPSWGWWYKTVSSVPCDEKRACIADRNLNPEFWIQIIMDTIRRRDQEILSRFTENHPGPVSGVSARGLGRERCAGSPGFWFLVSGFWLRGAPQASPKAPPRRESPSTSARGPLHERGVERRSLYPWPRLGCTDRCSLTSLEPRPEPRCRMPPRPGLRHFSVSSSESLCLNEFGLVTGFRHSLNLVRAHSTFV